MQPVEALTIQRVSPVLNDLAAPLSSSQRILRPNSTVGPGPALYGARGGGAGVFVNMFLIKPCQTLWRKGRRSARSGTDGSDWKSMRKQLPTQTRATVLLKRWGSLSLDHKASKYSYKSGQRLECGTSPHLTGQTSVDLSSNGGEFFQNCLYKHEVVTL